MPKVVFDISESAAFAGWLKRGLGDAAKRGIVSAASRTLQHIRGTLIPNAEHPPVDVGAYRAAWHLDPPSGTNAAGGVDVVNSLPYAGIIEHGARAENIKIGRKMIEALTKWVLRKGFFGKDSRSKSKADASGEAESMAWAIAVSMKKRGIFNKGLKIADKAAQYAAEVLPEELRRELRRPR